MHGSVGSSVSHALRRRCVAHSRLGYFSNTCVRIPVKIRTTGRGRHTMETRIIHIGGRGASRRRVRVYKMTRILFSVELRKNTRARRMHKPSAATWTRRHTVRVDTGFFARALQYSHTHTHCTAAVGSIVQQLRILCEIHVCARLCIMTLYNRFPPTAARNRGKRSIPRDGRGNRAIPNRRPSAHVKMITCR